MSDFSENEAAGLSDALLRCATGVDEPKRTRLRFTGFQFDRTPGGRCSAVVELEFVAGDSVTGRADGVTSPLGDLRVTAEATLRAIESFSRGTLRCDLIGVKTMRAFDANVVMVSVLAHAADGPRRLLGCHLSDDDQLRATVIATLQATNRMLGNAIATR
jgi:hypothetical protein